MRTMNAMIEFFGERWGAMAGTLVPAIIVLLALLLILFCLLKARQMLRRAGNENPPSLFVEIIFDTADYLMAAFVIFLAGQYISALFADEKSARIFLHALHNILACFMVLASVLNALGRTCARFAVCKAASDRVLKYLLKYLKD